MSVSESAYLVWCQKCHSDGDPTTLTRPEHKSLLALAEHTQSLQGLKIHDSSIPVGEVLAFRPGLTMAEQFNGNQVHGIVELFVGILALVQLA